MIIIEEGINKKDLMLQFNSFEFYNRVAGNLYNCIWSLASSHNTGEHCTTSALIIKSLNQIFYLISCRKY